MVEVSDPANPVEVGFYATPGNAYGVAVSGNLVFVADGDSGLRIVDVSDPTGPVEVGAHSTPDWARDVVVSGNHAFVAGGSSGLRVMDVSNPSNPVEVGFYDTPGYAEGVMISGNYIFVADGNTGVQVLEFLGTDVAEDLPPQKSDLRLVPTGPETFRLVFSTPLKTPASLALFTSDGRKIREIPLSPGMRSVNLRLLNLPPGVYVLRISFTHTPLRIALIR